jgi:hypothetical protein
MPRDEYEYANADLMNFGPRFNISNERYGGVADDEGLREGKSSV